MSLANLYNVPVDERSLNSWSLANQDHHLQIVNAIRAQKNTSLIMYDLDPIPLFDIKNWLRRHQTMHTDMTDVLDIVGNDLSDVDVNNREQMLAWINLHGQEHYQAELALKL